MPNIGIHIPNKGDFQRDLINSMGFDSATVLFENMDKAYALRADGFEGIILGRPYNSDVMQYEPEWWAEEMARQIAYLEGEYGYRVTDHYTPANELNLAGEHQGPTSNSQEYWESEEAYRRVNNWVYRWARRFRQLCPWAVLHFPAFAYGHGEDERKFMSDRSGLEICGDAIDICDVYDGHYYWSPSEGKQWSDAWHGMRYVLHEGELQRIGLTKPFFISEFNVPFGGSYELTEAEAAGQVFAWHEAISTYFGKRFLGDAWFIWDSLTADDHWSFPGFAIGPHTPEFLRLVAEYNHRQETPMAEDSLDQLLLVDTEFFNDPIVGKDFTAFYEWWESGGRLHYLRHRQAQGYEPIEEVGVYLTDLNADASALISQAYEVGQRHPKA